MPKLTIVRRSPRKRSTNCETICISALDCPLFAVWIKPGKSTTVSCGRLGPIISTLSVSWLKVLLFEIPMTSIASSIKAGSSLKFESCFLKLASCFRSSSDRLLDGKIVTDTFSAPRDRRRTICVANRVHRLSLRGKGISVMASRTEDFPELWSPQTTSSVIQLGKNSELERKLIYSTYEARRQIRWHHGLVTYQFHWEVPVVLCFGATQEMRYLGRRCQSLLFLFQPCAAGISRYRDKER
jgi:hypothetical protein